MARRRQGKRTGRRSAPWSTSNLYLVGGIATAIVVGVVIVIAVATSGSESAPDTIVVPTARPAGMAQDGLVLGDPNAPVSIVEYLDFQCPFCRRAAIEVMPAIEELYVAEGTAKIEIRPIAILGDESVRAAAAAQCANDQGAFWAYHDMLYANQGSERSGAFSDDRLKTFAEMLGLEAGEFNSCLATDRHRTAVLDATTEAQLAGVGSTPTILVNGQEVETSVDAISTAVQQAIEQ